MFLFSSFLFLNICTLLLLIFFLFSSSFTPLSPFTFASFPSSLSPFLRNNNSFSLASFHFLSSPHSFFFVSPYLCNKTIPLSHFPSLFPLFFRSPLLSFVPGLPIYPVNDLSILWTIYSVNYLSHELISLHYFPFFPISFPPSFCSYAPIYPFNYLCILLTIYSINYLSRELISLPSFPLFPISLTSSFRSLASTSLLSAPSLLHPHQSTQVSHHAPVSLPRLILSIPNPSSCALISSLFSHALLKPPARQL